MKEYAPGLPNKKRLSSIPRISSEIKTNYVLHEHHADRAGKHFDFRLNLNNKAYSWAMRYFPFKAGEKRLGIRQPDHTVEYMRFTGEIKDGYGKGKVYIKDSGKCKVEYAGKDLIKVVTLSTQHPAEILLKRTSEKNWIFLNVTRARKPSDPIGKKSYKDYTKKDISRFVDDDQYVFQPKIDGSHNLLLLEPGKHPRIVSHRESKRSDTGLIEHTHRFPGITKAKVDKEIAGLYRGEVYAVRKGKLLPAEELGGILNSKVDKSLDTQKDQKIQMRMALFGIPGDKHKKVLKFMGKGFEEVQTAKSKFEKSDMLEKIRNKQHPMTEEGIVIVNKSTGEPYKYRLRPDYDVYIRRMFPGQGKYAGIAVGGFEYSLSPRGPIIGKVGTGFTDALRIDMKTNSKKYIGKVATVHATRQTKKGVLFQPAFTRMHLDK